MEIEIAYRFNIMIGTLVIIYRNVFHILSFLRRENSRFLASCTDDVIYVDLKMFLFLGMMVYSHSGAVETRIYKKRKTHSFFDSIVVIGLLKKAAAAAAAAAEMTPMPTN